MLSWTIQITIISIVLIFLVHHLFNFFKSTLTVPKIKDLVNTPTQKYENMYNIINKNKQVNNNLDVNNEYTLIDLLPKKDDSTMKSELKNFLKSQLRSSQGSDIMALEQSNNSYSNY
jgi:hypothetical protein